MQRETAAAKKERALKIIAALQRTYPNAHCELIFSSPLQLLVATILSAQCTDKRVNLVTAELFKKYRSAEDFAAAPLAAIEESIKSTGFFRNKAKNVITLCEQLIRDFGGEVPRTREALETLAGVGRKTANVVLNMAFGQETIAVDTHLFRVANRIPLAIGKTPLAVELGLERIIPAPFRRHAHHWLILHGRYVCKARKPACEGCLIADLCTSPEKTI